MSGFAAGVSWSPYGARVIYQYVWQKHQLQYTESKP